MRRLFLFIVGKYQAIWDVIQGKIKLISEIAFLPTLILTLFQLWGIANATTQTAQEYISIYEKDYFGKGEWSEIDKFIDTTFENKKSFEDYKTKIIGIKDNIDIKEVVDKMASHFRAVLKCVEEERCDEERVYSYYEFPICSLWNKTKYYIEYKYDQNEWNKNYGDLISFATDRDCKAVEEKVNPVKEKVSPLENAEQQSIWDWLLA